MESENTYSSIYSHGTYHRFIPLRRERFIDVNRKATIKTPENIQKALSRFNDAYVNMFWQTTGWFDYRSCRLENEILRINADIIVECIPKVLELYQFPKKPIADFLNSVAQLPQEMTFPDPQLESTLGNDTDKQEGDTLPLVENTGMGDGDLEE